MQRGNPYHDERGRFTTPHGACRVSDERIRELALDSAEMWQEDNSEVEPDGYDYGQPYIRDGFGGYEDYDALMEEEKEEKADEYESEVRGIYRDYNKGICEKIKQMDYDTLKDFSDHPEKYNKDVLKAAVKSKDVYDAEGIAECAAEDFFDNETDVVDHRYRRIVSKCNGNRKLFTMASDEDEKYGLGGYAKNYATQRVKAKGLMGCYQSWKMTQGTGYSYNMIADSSKKLSSKKYPDGTYNAETLQPLEYENGYQVTYCQIGDNYTEEEHNKLMAEFLKHTDDGNVSLGKFEGTPEHSFHFKSKDQAIKFAQKYNQISVWDWENMEAVETGGTGRS